MPKNISRIIVVPTGKLGDIVCTTPVLAAVRKHFPDAKIIAAGPIKLLESLLSDSGLVDEFLGLDRHQTVSAIKKCGADIALVTGPTFEVTALLYLAGIPLVVSSRVVGGSSPLETRAYKILRNLIGTVPYRMGAYAPRERLRVLEPLGVVENDIGKHLGFSETARANVAKFFVDNGINTNEDFIIGISPSAGHKIKEWPEERFAEVADHAVVAHGAKILIIGGPEDKEKVGKTIASMKESKNVSAVTDFSIDELKALINELDIFVSVDTGPIYIAEAFGVPTIDITGPIDEREQPPIGPLHRNVVPPRRTHPELFVLDARSYNREEALRQTLSISVRQVTDATDELLTSINASGCVKVQ